MRVRFLGQEDPSGGGHSNPLQYYCLENPTDRGAWQAPVPGVTESDTTARLSSGREVRASLVSGLEKYFPSRPFLAKPIVL